MTVNNEVSLMFALINMIYRHIIQGKAISMHGMLQYIQSKSDLLRHMKIHTGEKLIQCRY